VLIAKPNGSTQIVLEDFAVIPMEKYEEQVCNQSFEDRNVQAATCTQFYDMAMTPKSAVCDLASDGVM
jgi:hypothetical protein